MPKSPLEAFLGRIFDAVDDAAEDLIREANKQAKENIKRMLTQTRVANRLDPARPFPQPKKRAPRGREPGARPTVTPPRVTLYDVLECSPRASQETLTAAFRSLSTRFHPDTGKVKNESRYKDITAAWNVLKNVERRKAYDKSIGLL